MILMSAQLNNVYGFNNLDFNLSYPRLLTKTTIENEYLEGHSNFRYKKAIILKGANASGKTSLGKALLNIFRYIIDGTPEIIYGMVADKTKPSYCSIDFVNSLTMELLRFVVEVVPASDESKNAVINNYYSTNKIRLEDSYESCKKELDTLPLKSIDPSQFSIIKSSGNIAFNFALSENTNVTNKLQPNEKKAITQKVLDRVLKTLDPTIEKVFESKEVENTFVIERGKQQIIIQDGVLQEKGAFLSTGTREGIKIAYLMASIIQHSNGFYYIDEQFSHIQADLEKRLFSIMVQKLGPNEQIFITTHSSDMSDLNLPKHSFAFFRKEKFNNMFVTSIMFASDILKRDTDSVRCAEDNDVFNSLPDESLLDDLDYEEAQ